MLTDTEIESQLRPLQPLGFAKVPHEGIWAQPPFERRAIDGRHFAVLCIDARVQELIIEVETGAIYTHPLGEPQLFLANSSLASLVSSSQAYQEAASAAVEAESADDPDRARNAVAQALHERLRAIDPAATADHDASLWLVAAEELGYGM